MQVIRKTSRRARRINLSVRPDGTAVLSVPVGMQEWAVTRFWQESQDWLARQIARMARYRNDVFLPRTRREYLLRKTDARRLVLEHLDFYAAKYGFRFGRVSIKNLTRNWGSCSESGNLNFNYKLVFLPERAAAYVVFHELCHLEEFSHNARFWALVAREFPDHAEVRQGMRRFHP